MLSYSIDYEKMKSEVFKCGFDDEDWSNLELGALSAIHKAGFKSPEDVRRAADKNGRRIG